MFLIWCDSGEKNNVKSESISQSEEENSYVHVSRNDFQNRAS